MKRKYAGFCPYYIVAVAIAAFPSVTLGQIEEVIVTAKKREQSLQDVPIALQAFSGDQIRELGVARASDVVMLAPNMAISQQNMMNSSIAIRGIGTSDLFAAGNGALTVMRYTCDGKMGYPQDRFSGIC